MYTKKSLADQVLIAVLGGKLTEDANVWFEDIAAYIPAAISFVLQQDIDERIERESLQQRRMRSNIMPVVNNEYTFVYDLVVLHDDARDLHFMNLPGKLIKLSSTKGISQIVPYNGVPLTIVKNQGETIGLENIGQAFAWIEYYTNVDKVMIQGHRPAVTNLLVHAAIDPADMNDSDPLPIPQHLELKVVEICVSFFTKQRGIPADPVADNSDVNEVRYN